MEIIFKIGLKIKNNNLNRHGNHTIYYYKIKIILFRICIGKIDMDSGIKN